MSTNHTIVVSTLDMDRISALLEQMPKLSPELEKLEDELDRATIKEPQEMPDNVVSMNSTVRFKFMGKEEIIQKNLVYPNEVKSNDDISIFAPVGSALLGLAAGQTLTWPMPGGAEKTIEILEVVYQPEREGGFSR
ncbi:nucleoside diphosphate kinase regulator [Klebsiella pneumoniae]|uniref:Nucleoside diphosphate kinase regulator n=1 Tax=Proteus penneri TaxID=102862 RepID=A0A2P1BQD1_9GAMM|nr:MULTISPECIES: nucleoside diphosphate kinase regulator [Gammaproteobacteria]MCU2475448.1 nucleoside diphosphate kinase regulator [Enterobacter hormaechei subsp. xiangfangensis]MCU3244212.1 nucleoside diphosphate kinase regulator [Enterobacter hormaechei subsp. steigerwaltii]MCU3503317.1 nucleoside diphosphate kinase regulator [Enterobacter hormaechei subsp. hoffmannii]MDQ5571029.1 nucleoside diphosphate kinase regulator [Klebsiella pneumoniae]AVI43955.1 nucleoside diphosphate kinase regulato